jgi:UDP-N-acetylglucosamine--N-acetylmuramyl-(pentapeptide) pyrophosphoryl-undecaprenol N-acetylglucosamine transferase
VTTKANSYKVLFVAGGTGGHIVPALAVAQKLKQLKPEVEIIFCGVGKEAEKKLIIPAGFELIELPAPPFRGVSISKKLTSLCGLPGTIFKARKIITSRKINSLIAFGGYPSVCPLIGAWTLGIKTVLHEQNQQVGLANKLLERFATKVFAVVGAKGFKHEGAVTFLPLPVREEFRSIPPLELNGEPRLLVLGGSQGAKSVNNAIIELLPYLREKKVSIFHQSGSADFERVTKAYEGYERGQVAAFTNDVSTALKNAWIVVSRAGAMSVAENCASGRAAIYIPLKIAGAHQSANIELVMAKGAAICVTQDENLIENLKNVIDELLNNPKKLLEIGRNARALSLEGEQASEGIIAAELVVPKISTAEI